LFVKFNLDHIDVKRLFDPEYIFLQTAKYIIKQRKKYVTE